MKRRPLIRILWAFVSVTVILAFVLYLRAFAGRVRDYEVSPDGRKVAEWVETGETSATTTNETSVALRTKSDPIRHVVFSGLDYGGKISIDWIDSQNLLITCSGCAAPDETTAGATSISVLQKDAKWRDVSIHYVIR